MFRQNDAQRWRLTKFRKKYGFVKIYFDKIKRFFYEPNFFKRMMDEVRVFEKKLG